MKHNFLIITAIAALFMALSSCKNSPVVANYNSIVLAPDETVKVEISGGGASINVSLTQHESDSIFSISDFKKHSIVVTGNNEGKDTLMLFYNRGIFANGECLIIPVSVEK